MTTPQTYLEALEAGRNAIRIGSTADAVQYFELAVQLAQGDAELGEAQARLARTRAVLGDYPLAETLLKEALRRTSPYPTALAQVRTQFGIVRWLKGDMPAARLMLEDAQAEFKRQGLIRDRSIALGNLAIVLLAMGEYQRAINVMEETLALDEHLDDQQALIIGCGNLGECFLNLGAYERARPLFERAIGLAGHIDAPALATDALRNLGRLYALAGDVTGGLALIQESLARAERYQRRHLHAQALGALAELHLQRPDYAAAEALGHELLARAGQSAHHRAHARRIIGLCALGHGDALHALQTLEDALLDAQASADKLEILHCHAALGQVVAIPAVGEIHRRIARELADQISDVLEDKALRQAFRNSALVLGLR